MKIDYGRPAALRVCIVARHDTATRALQDTICGRQRGARTKHQQALAEIGFVPSRSRRLFTSESSDYLVEFPASPLAVGNELIYSRARLETDYGPIQILTPTQSVKDRLAAYIHWNDHQAFDQAVEIAVQKTDVDMQSIRDWAIGEQDLAMFEQFEGRVKQQQRI